uniref:Uncharacterized protein n=1 Tax=Anguilla anguilla TaxID=7936 RepID=A0A0E9PHR1_ANGAN
MVSVCTSSTRYRSATGICTGASAVLHLHQIFRLCH